MKRTRRIRFALLTAAACISCAALVPGAGAVVSHHHRSDGHRTKTPPGTAAPKPPATAAATSPVQPADPASDDEDVNFDPTEVDVDSFPVPPGVDPPAAPQGTNPSPSPPSSGPSSPQVVTVLAPQAPAVVTTPSIAVPAPKPYCSNHPEFGQGPLPRGWVKDVSSGTCSYVVCLNYPSFKLPLPQYWHQDNASGNCYFRGPDEVDMCDNDQFHHLVKDQVAAALKGYTMAIMVDGVGLVCLLSDVKAFHANPDNYEFSNTYVEGGDTHFPLYSCQTPFGDDTVPFYKFYVRKGTTVTPTAKEEPGCKPAPAKVAAQTQLSVQQHGLLWGGHHYGSVQVFARVLAREGSTWRGWKKNHPALARGLAAHGATYPRRRK